MDLEDRLRLALRRVEPGDDFADRVMARLEGAGAAPAVAARSAWRRWALAASVLLAVALGAAAWRGREVRLERIAQAQERARSEEAARQLAWALDITSRQLENVHRRLDQDTRKERGS